MGKTRNRIAFRLLLSLIIFLPLILFSQGESSAETMVSSPLPSKGAKGLAEGWENSWFGVGFFDGKSKMKTKGGSESFSFNLDITQLYGEYGYRIDPWKEVFIRVGSAKFDVQDLNGGSGKFFGTLGFNYKWYISSNYSIWSSFQGTYYYPQKFRGVADDNTAEQIELSPIFGWTVAPIAADYRIPISSYPELLTVYGGLVATSTSADMEITNLSTGMKSSGDQSIKNKSYFGGFAGLRIVPLKAFNIDIEGQYVDRFSFGLKLVYAFPVDY